MMTKQVIDISDAEWEVMRVIWTLGQSTSNEIFENLNGKMDWQMPTIKTLLGRLVKKGALSADKDGRAFIYKPLIEEQTTMDHVSQLLFDHMCQMKIGSTIADLLSEVALSQSDIMKLQAVIDQKAKTAPEMVECNCLAKEV
ncbi:CopY/TcrY family copper transport repressor [Dellaglioa sp. BT-FLS60]